MPDPTTSPLPLVLVPTEVEERRLLDLGGVPAELGEVRLCGFGPIAAAARTVQLVGELDPPRVLLLGIAGAYDTDRDPVGEARVPAEVALFGVGAGDGSAHQGPPALGFPQLPGAGDRPPVEDRLDLTGEGGLLVTTCAASDSPAEADLRRARFEGAALEDMEGFGVALACALVGVPCTVVRGVSNRVGDRDPSRWNIPRALMAARERALRLLEEHAESRS